MRVINWSQRRVPKPLNWVTSDAARPEGISVRRADAVGLLINSDRPQQAPTRVRRPFLTSRARRSSLRMKSRMNEPLFSLQFFFACNQRPASGPIKAYMSPASPHAREGGRWKNHKIAIGRIPLRVNATQYGFDGRSFNINCGFSADGNVFFFPFRISPPLRRDEVVCAVVCDALWRVADELALYAPHFGMRLYGFECLFCSDRNVFIVFEVVRPISARLLNYFPSIIVLATAEIYSSLADQ